MGKLNTLKEQIRVKTRKIELEKAMPDLIFEPFDMGTMLAVSDRETTHAFFVYSARKGIDLTESEIRETFSRIKHDQ